MTKNQNGGLWHSRVVSWPVAFFVRASGLVLTVALVLGIGLVILLPFVLDEEPGFDVSAAPDAASAANAAVFARSLSTLVSGDERNLRWATSVADLNGALVTAGRILPGARIRAGTENGPATFLAALDLSRFPGNFWLNWRIGVEGSPEGLKLTKVQVGDLVLPEGVVLRLLRFTANIALKDGLGDVLFDSVSSAKVEGGTLSAGFTFSDGRRDDLVLRIREVFRDFSGSPDPALVYSYLWMFAREGREHGLPARGSVLPYLDYVLRRSAWQGAGPDPEQAQAALLALAIYCGDESLHSVFGLGSGSPVRNYCQGTTLRGRDDLKRHFMVSAGLYAARSGMLAVGVGELKELLDSNSGGTGFSFDDMAANAAGIRFAKTMLAATPAQRRELAKLLIDETSIFPATEGLRSGLSEEEFQALYGDVNSPEYRDLLAQIERRIDALAYYQGGSARQ